MAIQLLDYRTAIEPLSSRNWINNSNMKLSLKQYAKILSENEGSDKKKIAEKFWYLLQKNNQYKDLAKILAELNSVYAKKHNSIFAEIISENKLSDDEIKEIEVKLEMMLRKKIISQNIVRENFGPGIVVKTDDLEIDMSAVGQIDKLKQKLSN